MARIRVVRPEVVRLTLSDGDFIDVKKELTAGEYQTFIGAITLPREFGSTPEVETSQVGLRRLIAYVVGWNFIGLDEQPLPYDPSLPEDVRADTLRSLDAETFTEMIGAIDAHEAQVDRAKKAPRIAIASASI